MRVGFLEGNRGWLPCWLHRLDDQWHKYGGGESVKPSTLPSKYFRRRCFIGTDVDEALLRVVIDDIGRRYLRHVGGLAAYRRAFSHGLETSLALPGVDTDSKQNIMWDNCLRLYGFPEEALFASMEG